jgi:hypothetical protein
MNKVCQFIHVFINMYWVVIKHILSYLKGIVSCDLYITCSSFLSLYGYININWTDNIDDHKSTYMYLSSVFILCILTYQFF